MSGEYNVSRPGTQRDVQLVNVPMHQHGPLVVVCSHAPCRPGHARRPPGARTAKLLALSGDEIDELASFVRSSRQAGTRRRPSHRGRGRHQYLQPLGEWVGKLAEGRPEALHQQRPRAASSRNRQHSPGPRSVAAFRSRDDQRRRPAESEVSALLACCRREWPRPRMPRWSVGRGAPPRPTTRPRARRSSPEGPAATRRLRRRPQRWPPRQEGASPFAKDTRSGRVASVVD
jgi:hypothetical protein